MRQQMPKSTCASVHSGQSIRTRLQNAQVQQNTLTEAKNPKQTERMPGMIEHFSHMFEVIFSFDTIFT